VAAGAVDFTFSAARLAFDFESKDSPELATFSLLLSTRRQRHLLAESSYSLNLAITNPLVVAWTPAWLSKTRLLQRVDFVSIFRSKATPPPGSVHLRGSARSLTIHLWRYGCLVLSEDLIQDAGQRLVEAATKPAKVVLFGSHAHGFARTNSDLDLLVIEQEISDRNAEFVRLRRSLRGLGVAVDLIVVSEDNVDEWRDVPGTLINEALREGRVLAEA
jgi:uncharacterized protein